MKEPRNGRIRVAAAQYHIRPIRRWEDFAAQVSAVAGVASGYRCRLLVLPEYFTTQLFSLHDYRRPISDLVRDVAQYLPQFQELMTGLARENGLYIVAGTIPVVDDEQGRVYNDSFVFSPEGEVGVQGKLHMTRFEKEDWLVSARNRLRIFETDFCKMAVAICYDVEFPELARAAAHEGIQLLVVPSCTDDRMGFLRVRFCAHARAIENQLYVVHAPTVGSLPFVPDAASNYGNAAVLTPHDYAFSRDGILAQGEMNQEQVVVGEVDMKVIDESRTFGTVLPLNDSQHSRELVANIENVQL